MNIVIIGSGAAGVTLAEELRKLNPEKDVRIITEETHGVYARPMLSHGFTREDIEQKIILKSFESLEAIGVTVDSGSSVTAIDPEAHQIQIQRHESTESLSYDTLVLAPGSDTFVPPSFEASFSKLRTVNGLDDLIGLRRLRQTLQSKGQKPHWALIGGGLIGCEVASDMARAGDDVTLIHPVGTLMERQLEDDDARLLENVLKEQGVTVTLNTAVNGINKTESGTVLDTTAGRLGPFDGVLLCTGFKPRTDLPKAAGLDTGRGIRVDQYLKTSGNDIYAIGDAAECADGKIYAYILPVKQQALWLAQYLTGQTQAPWTPPLFKPRTKVHGFVAVRPYKS